MDIIYYISFHIGSHLCCTQPSLQVFGVVSRYAHALFSAATKQKAPETTEKELTEIKVDYRACFHLYFIGSMIVSSFPLLYFLSSFLTLTQLTAESPEDRQGLCCLLRQPCCRPH
jgi:hypothetical protein